MGFADCACVFVYVCGHLSESCNSDGGRYCDIWTVSVSSMAAIEKGVLSVHP